MINSRRMCNYSSGLAPNFLSIKKLSSLLQCRIKYSQAILLHDGSAELKTLESLFKCVIDLTTVIDLYGLFGDTRVPRLFMIKTFPTAETNFEYDAINIIETFIEFFIPNIKRYLKYFHNKYITSFKYSSTNAKTIIQSMKSDEIGLYIFFDTLIKKD